MAHANDTSAGDIRITRKQRIHLFFERPKTAFAKAVQIFIFILILASLYNLYVEIKYPATFAAYQLWFILAEAIILSVFTVEYVLRVWAAPKRLAFAAKPMSIIDFLAIAPSYLEMVLPLFFNTSSIRILRLVKVLRFSRVLRAFRLFRYGNLLRKIVRYERTILQTITPVIALFGCAKVVIWLMEINHLWIANANLGELFAIIGFALGIILSQKIGVTYDKFLQIEEAAIRIDSYMRSISLIFDRKEKGLGKKITLPWVRTFLSTLKDPQASNAELHTQNEKLSEAMSTLEDVPAEMITMHANICQDAAFCLSKKVRLTPKAYDTLLHQATMLYFLLIVIFIPGFTGLVSSILATYTLYGMYNLTEDLDSIIGGEFNLIDIDISELEEFAKGE